ncbi:MAG: polysaccharide deacetylase family protein [Chloroflexi bacterium]|jgi:N-acetyl-anhydromuramyl-L-alanine amidase AmpD/peptidoglycan/xylan/chitin deacetylase (PgdA/CDA1 family)|nr:polysaccharide deacetylase family protein [Chloroflexota bacterium]MBT4003944.1 polysaccharide deacetylase family protein [Chloroflexota bacterium]MBT4305750.1 polysaccharide deacetylase family protein [Chloroflexota bacterium]MBT4533574.1 polysaccharide deacetylase family protein [Chloroflexota bacterium]MBT4681783.1 polysaccharide deacetylase family protein [Chloroflexota bacterium]
MQNYPTIYTNNKYLLVILLLSVLLFGCQGNIENEPASTENVVVTPSILPTEASTSTEFPDTPAPTETLSPSPTPTPSPLAWRIPVLEYHNPTYFGGENVKMTEEWFVEQIEWLKENNFKTLTGEEILGFIGGTFQPQKYSVALRFDMGVPKYDEYANIVIPALRNNGFHALFFLITPSFTDDCTHPEDRICWQDLIDWEEEGLITIGSHGVDHPDYAEITKAYASQDAGVSKQIIEAKLGHSINLFAYPFDSVPQNPEGILKPLGYMGGFSGWPEFQDRSLEFGSQLFWEIPSYYPYSGDNFYPEITTAGPYFGSIFPEMLFKAIEVSETEIAEMAGRAATPSNDEVIDPTATPAEMTRTESVLEETAEPATDPYFQFTHYCLSNYNKVLDVNYLESIAFPPDISQHSLELLSSSVIVKPVCHFDRNNAPEAIVLHYTGSLANHEGSLDHFRDPTSGTSAHYFVERDGTIIQLLPESYVANHVSCYGNPAVNCLPNAPLVYDENGTYTRPATRSIGIEIVNAGPLVFRDKNPDVLSDKFGTEYHGTPFVYDDFDPIGRYRYEFWEPFSDAQLEALAILIEDIQSRWGFEMVVGHNDLQTNIDPGPALQEFIDQYH